MVVARGSKGLFAVRVREQIAGNPALIAIIEPLLAVWSAIRDQVTMLDRQILARARNDQVARRLMTVVEPLTKKFVIRRYVTIDPIVVRNFFSITLFYAVKDNVIGEGSWTNVQAQTEPH